MSGQNLLFAAQQQKTLLTDRVTLPPQVKYFVLNADELLKNPDLAPGFALSDYPADHFIVTTLGDRFLHGDIKEFSRLFPQIPVVFQ